MWLTGAVICQGGHEACAEFVWTISMGYLYGRDWGICMGNLYGQFVWEIPARSMAVTAFLVAHPKRSKGSCDDDRALRSSW